MSDDVMQAFRLDGRTAVVTGGASGIGEATATTLAAAGANVVVGDLNEDGATDTVRQIEEAGGKAIALRTDVTKKSEMDALVDAAVEHFGGLHVMCNVAGIAHDGKVYEATEEDFDKIFAVNLKSVLFGCQAASRVMRERETGGSIINVSSTSIDTPAPGYALYAMTKVAVHQLTKTLSLEVGKYGIRVNTIAPGMTITPFTARHAYDEDGTLNQEKYDGFVEMMKKLSPLRIVGDPMDQAYLTLYLASDAARFCTGQIWRANGGQAIV